MNQAHLLAILTALVGDRAFIQSFESGALPETLDYYLDLARRLLAAAEASVPDLPFNLDDLGDVVITSPATGSLLQFDGVNWVDTTVAAVMDPTYLRLDTNNDPLSGDLAMGSNDITGIRTLQGGGAAAGFLGIEHDSQTTQTGGSRAIALDPEFLSQTGGVYVGTTLAPGLASGGATFDSLEFAGHVILGSGGATYVFRGSTGNVTLVGLQFGSSDGSASAIELRDTSVNNLNAFLFQHRQTYKAINGAAQVLAVASFNDEPEFFASGAGSSLEVRCNAIASQPHFVAPTGGATGTVTGTEGVDGLIHFACHMEEYGAGWSMNERVGFGYKSPSTSTDGGTIGTEYVLKTHNISVDNPSAYLAPAGSRYLIYSDDPTGVIAHAGKMSLGAISGSPAATLAVTGTGRFTDVVTSTVSTGTAPFTIASTTKVTNLNADLLDDQSGAYYLDSANFTGTNWTDLTDGGGTTLHTHAHTNLTGNTSGDDHTQYALLAGRSGGQTLIGGTAAADFLKLQATAGVGAGSEFISFLVGNNGATEAARITSAGLDVAAHMAVGSSASVSAADVITLTETFTDTTNRQAVAIQYTWSPSGSPSGETRGIYSQVFTGSASVNYPGLQSFQSLAQHNVASSTVTALRGYYGQAIIGGLLSEGVGSATVAAGMQGQAIHFSADASTSVFGALCQVTHQGSGAATNLIGAQGQLNHVSGSGTSTNAAMFRGSTNTWTGGTITNPYGLWLANYPSGVTYTNPPELIRIESQTATNAMAIRQVGTDDYNRFAGLTSLGADSNATAKCHLGAGTTAASSAPLKFTDGAFMTNTEAGAVEYNDDMFMVTGANLQRQQIITDQNVVSYEDDAVMFEDAFVTY